ncbi:Type 1 glutamine amidotransferase-like domain-containing protein [Bacillus suaedaesalsae]|uniref:Type 1 glutamine amidotransferase-like domain-containing protein n=1 Tax=Bacillus suaedaesalsae TaxID=2810349 RepID=A0ABS2DMR4_9BACI|nr:Type 1 glutamine amidotransferase-like domain-containing protein [Bacillus suaedaesalsae]MBM6618763.1 Type 1 glutamine amidotransferase-like domain-containing protein [Bacillus suaedaesalsae]
MMRILLTSKGFSNQCIQSAFLNLLTLKIEHVKVAIITTAAVELKEKHPRVIEAKKQFQSMGICYVDFVDVELDEPSKLEQYDVIYLTGGNPFYLLEQMKKTGADIIIKRKAEEGTILIGVSAGSLVLGPHLQIVKHFTPQLIENVKLCSLNAINLYKFPIMPHYDREDVFPGDLTIEDRIVKYEEQSGEDVVRLKDEEALLLTIDEVKLISLPNDRQ